MSTSRPPLHGLTILIVDDPVDTITLFVEYLGLMGAKVIGAGWAEAALMVVETERPHAIITDLRLPGEDGRWLLRQLRALPTPMALIPVYAMSGQRRDRRRIPFCLRVRSRSRGRGCAKARLLRRRRPLRRCKRWRRCHRRR